MSFLDPAANEFGRSKNIRMNDLTPEWRTESNDRGHIIGTLRTGGHGDHSAEAMSNKVNPLTCFPPCAVNRRIEAPADK